MRLACLLVILASWGALAGCASSERDQVKAKVDQFAEAAAGRDYATICSQVLAPALLARLAGSGITCRQAMRVALSSVNQPSISIGRITIHGRRAQVITLSTARGQEAALTAIELVKVAAGWRIAALGSPLSPARG